MPTGQIYSVSTGVTAGTLSLELTYHYSGKAPASVDFSLSATHPKQVVEISAVADLRTGAITPKFFANVSSTTCLTACAGAALVKALIECFNTDVSKYISCLQSKGLSSAGDIAACALGCFVGTSSSPP